VLLSGEAKKIARLDVLAIERKRSLERRLRVGGHYAISCEHHRLAERGLPLGGLAVETKRVAPRLDRLFESPEPQIDRRHDLPATAVLRVGLEMSLDLRHKRLDRAALALAVKARGERLVRQRRGAEREIEPARTERQDDERDDGNRATP